MATPVADLNADRPSISLRLEVGTLHPPGKPFLMHKKRSRFDPIPRGEKCRWIILNLRTHLIKVKTSSRGSLRRLLSSPWNEQSEPDYLPV